MEHYLDFEKPVMEVAARIRELRETLAKGGIGGDNSKELDRLHMKEKRALRQLYRNLTPWQRTQVARHPDRPHAIDYIENLITDFQPLAGDRAFADDKTMLAGIGTFAGQSVVVLGTEKGRKTAERVKYNFGMPKPEGYRKARRIMQMADRFKLPLITFVDTPGAFPGIDAEARGQAEAIAACIQTLLEVEVPVISVITGEGGSGGALAIAVADRVIMLENSIYSVISPEGCASILWRDRTAAEKAADALNLTAKRLVELGVADEMLREPVGGAHRDKALTFKRVEEAVTAALKDVQKAGGNYCARRRERFLAMTGEYGQAS